MNESVKKLRCLTVDDEPHALQLLQLYIEKTPFLELAAATTSPWEALDLLKAGQVDLLFLDIQMEDLTGLQVLDLAGKTCPVILTTAYSEYALKGYEYRVTDYLLKPFSFERFLKAVTPLAHAPSPEPPDTNPTASPTIQATADSLFVKGDAKHKYHKINLKEVCYIEGLRNYVYFICQAHKVITLQNLKSLETELPTDRFVRIHKSYIVNIDQVEEVEGNSLLVQGKRLPIGGAYRERFYELIKRKRMG